MKSMREVYEPYFNLPAPDWSRFSFRDGNCYYTFSILGRTVSDVCVDLVENCNIGDLIYEEVSMNYSDFLLEDMGVGL